MSYGFAIEVSGERACFTRPELKAERVSYDVITPSAARGIIESVFWHPGLSYVIDKIHVLNEIRFGNIRRNEVKSKAAAKDVISAATQGKASPHIIRKDDINQRATMYLRDVRYVIEFHFEMTQNATPSDNPGKFSEMLRRRLSKGQCFSQPVLGVREFPAKVALIEGDIPGGFYAAQECRDLGLMLYDLDYSKDEVREPQFYRAVMRHGVIDVAGSEVYR